MRESPQSKVIPNFGIIMKFTQQRRIIFAGFFGFIIRRTHPGVMATVVPFAIEECQPG
jgi:hypothetical protein